MGRITRLGVVAGFVVLSVGIAALGIHRELDEQSNLGWVFMGGVLLAFVAGFAVMETVIGNVRRDFQMEVEQARKKTGRPLTEQEMAQLSADFKAKRRQGESNIKFPLQRLVFRLILLLPAIFVNGFLVAVGAFVAGFFISGLIAEYQRRTLSYF